MIPYIWYPVLTQNRLSPGGWMYSIDTCISKIQTAKVWRVFFQFFLYFHCQISKNTNWCIVRFHIIIFYICIRLFLNQKIWKQNMLINVFSLYFIHNIISVISWSLCLTSYTVHDSRLSSVTTGRYYLHSFSTAATIAPTPSNTLWTAVSHMKAGVVTTLLSESTFTSWTR